MAAVLIAKKFKFVTLAEGMLVVRVFVHRGLVPGDAYKAYVIVAISELVVMVNLYHVFAEIVYDVPVVLDVELLAVLPSSVAADMFAQTPSTGTVVVYESWKPILIVVLVMVGILNIRFISIEPFSKIAPMVVVPVVKYPPEFVDVELDILAMPLWFDSPSIDAIVPVAKTLY